jgi:hypothetical protein
VRSLPRLAASGAACFAAPVIRRVTKLKPGDVVIIENLGSPGPVR